MNTDLLTDYWRVRRPALGAPPRSSIDPTQFLPLLPQVFILGRAAAGRYSFRLVGGLLADLHDRDLRQTDFLTLWQSPDRPSLQSAIEGAVRRSQPLVVSARARSPQSGVLDMEVLLAPLAGADGSTDRLLGLYQPLSPLSRLTGRPIGDLTAHSVGLADSLIGAEPLEEAPRLRLASVNGRRVG